MTTSSGASKAPAVSGSMASASTGIPTVAAPPPNAPFMKAMMKTPQSAAAMAAGSVARLKQRPPDARYRAQRGFRTAAIRTAGLGHIRPPAAARATQRFGSVFTDRRRCSSWSDPR